MFKNTDYAALRINIIDTEPHRRHCVVVLGPSLVLVQPRKTRPCLTERMLMGHKESTQTKNYGYGYHFPANNPPGRPTNVTLLADGRNIAVRWDPPYVVNDDIHRYMVTWAILPDFTDLSSGIVLDGNTTIAFIAVNEDVGRVFRVRVRAENVYSIGEYSLPRYVRIGKIFNDHSILVHCKKNGVS